MAVVVDDDDVKTHPVVSFSSQHAAVCSWLALCRMLYWCSGQCNINLLVFACPHLLLAGNDMPSSMWGGGGMHSIECHFISFYIIYTKPTGSVL